MEFWDYVVVAELFLLAIILAWGTYSAEFIVTSPILIEVVIGGLIAGFALFIAQIGVNFYYRPQLDIESERREYPFDNGITSVRVRVKNNGRGHAENCTGKITLGNVEAVDLIPSLLDKGVYPILDYQNFMPIEAMGLHWANLESTGSITVNSHDFEILDVCKLYFESNGKTYISIYTEGGAKNPRCILKDPEDKEGNRYQGTIHISVANGERKDKDFTMYFDKKDNFVFELKD